MKDSLILVDEHDVVIGTAEKIDTHRKGLLHRAFSLFIYDESENKILLQKRAINKYHSGGLWTNACCSHPRKGEKTIQAVIRRTKEELGVIIHENDIETNNLCEVGVFKYRKDFEDCIEYEIDHVYMWITSSDNICVMPDRDEIESVKWIYLKELENWMKNSPEEFTAWFPDAYSIFKNQLGEKNYTKARL